jgi:hypothetical protein
MVEATLTLVGIVGLIGGNLTVSRDHPLKGPRARVAGLILATALPLSHGASSVVFALVSRQALPYTMVGPILRLLDPLPASVVIVGTSAYLYASNPRRDRATLLFWLMAALPAAALFVVRNLVVLFQLLFQLSMALPLPFAWRLELPNCLIGGLTPILTAFASNLVYPVAIDRRRALSYAAPLACLHAYYYAVSDWIYPAISSIAHPGDTPGAGYQELINGIVALGLSSLLMGLVAFVSWCATRLRGPHTSAA